VREEELSALLDSAMDAVVVLDATGAITRVNPGAERLFACTAEDLLGENLREFLPPESAAQFDAFVKELDTQTTNRPHLWIPQSLPVLRWDKSTFPAEATISRFANRGQVFHTVILRNVDERLAAERRIALLVEEAEYLRESVREFAGMGDILGSSAALKELFESVKRVAVTDATVLIFGETGTGKELIARSIHQAGARKDRPLVRVNCAAIPGERILWARARRIHRRDGPPRGAFRPGRRRRSKRRGCPPRSASLDLKLADEGLGNSAPRLTRERAIPFLNTPGISPAMIAEFRDARLFASALPQPFLRKTSENRHSYAFEDPGTPRAMRLRGRAGKSRRRQVNRNEKKTETKL
jgi:PAS domain S-box-containing protein